MFKLRPYQEEGTQACLDILQSKKKCREIVIIGTGGGKSHVLAEVAKRLNEPLLILQPSAVLLQQNYEKFIKAGGKASMCCASLKTKTIKGVDYTEVDGELIKCREVSRITFATTGSVIKHVSELKALGVKKIAIDEVHLNTQSGTEKKNGKTVEKQPQIKKLIALIGATNITGVTATGLYLKGSMGGSSLKIMTRVKWKLFTKIRYINQISNLVENGWWSKLIYQVNETDTKILEYNSSGSDYTVESLKDYYESNNLKDQIIEEIKNLKKEGRKSIMVFVSTIQEANELYKSVPNSAIVHSKLDLKTRNYFVKAFKSLEIPVVFNVSCLLTGFDHPLVDAIITARPTSSIAVYYQGIGRGVRIHPEKENCKIVDFSGNVSKFGKVEELEYCDLEGYGVGLFNGRGELLTEYPLQIEERPTKESILTRIKGESIKKENSVNPEFPWGMFKGRRLFDVAKSKDAKRLLSYCGWVMSQHNKGEFILSKDLHTGIKEYLLGSAMNFKGKESKQLPKENNGLPF